MGDLLVQAIAADLVIGEYLWNPDRERSFRIVDIAYNDGNHKPLTVTTSDDTRHVLWYGDAVTIEVMS